jgi:hypothetical protein
MPKKYMFISFFAIIAACLALYGFNYGESQMITKSKHLSVKKETKSTVSQKLATNDDMVAAILIMPKSYLPALKRFSQSRMARDIKILRAQIDLKDGQMTAVQYKKPAKRKDHEMKPANTPTPESSQTIAKLPPKKEKQILSTGFLYLLAGIQRSRMVVH